MTKKTALVIVGPGFSDSTDLIEALKRLDWSVACIEPNLLTPEHVEQAEAVFLRGPWTDSLEESVYVKQLAQKLGPVFRGFHGHFLKGEKLLFAIGRGALILVELGLAPISAWSRASWINTPISRTSSIVDAEVLRSSFSSEHRLKVGLYSSCLPSQPAEAALGYQPWVQVASVENESVLVLAWSIPRAIMWSLVDLFAVSERAQLQGYGHDAIGQVSLDREILEALLKRDF